MLRFLYNPILIKSLSSKSKRVYLFRACVEIEPIFRASVEIFRACVDSNVSVDECAIPMQA